MRNTRWTLAAAAVAAIGASGNACAQSPTEQARSMHQGILINRGDFPHSEIDFRFGDHQRFKDYF